MAPRFIADSATTSWPCPSDTIWKFLSADVYPNCLPRVSTSLRGLTPGDKMKNIGVAEPKNEELKNIVEWFQCKN